MTHAILPLDLYYDGVFQGPTVEGPAGSTSGAADQVTVGRSSRWADYQGGIWFVGTGPSFEDPSGQPKLFPHFDPPFPSALAPFPYCLLTRPAVESFADQRAIVTTRNLYDINGVQVALRYQSSGGIALAFYLMKVNYHRLKVILCRSGMADSILLDRPHPGGDLNALVIHDLFRLDTAAIRYWPTRLLVEVVNLATGVVLNGAEIEDSTASLQQPGAMALAMQMESPPYYNTGATGYLGVQLYGSNRWQNQPVIVFSARANPAAQAQASLIYSAVADLPRCNARIVFSARADLPRCNAAIVFHAAVSASDSIVLPHTYSRSASASLVFSASSSCTVIPGHRVTAHASLVYSAVADCRVKHRYASALIRYRATAVEHATIRPVHGAAPLLYRARARLRRPPAPSSGVSSALEYLGRFQAGTDFTVPVLMARLPAVDPFARAYDLAPGPLGRARLVEILGLAPTRHPLVFVLGVTLGVLYHPGRYVLVYSGLPGAASAVFEVTTGGDPAGAVIAAHALEFSAGPRLVAHLDSGVLLVGAKPSIT